MHVEIRIQGLEDVGNALYPELAKETVKHHGAVTHIGIMEHGMTSGKTSVMIFGQDEKGIVALELGAEMFDTIAGAVKGAVQRFGK